MLRTVVSVSSPPARCIFARRMSAGSPGRSRGRRKLSEIVAHRVTT